MPWLLRCRWGSLLCARTISFQVAVVESQLRAARRRSHVRCESRRMSGSREERRTSKSNGRAAPGPSGLHEGGGIRGVIVNGRRHVVNDVVLSSGCVGSGPRDGEGLGAGSRDRQEIYTCGSSSPGFGGLVQGVSSWCSSPRKPGNGNQKTVAGMSNRNHRQTANQTAIITDFADWRALWSVVWLWYPESRKVPRRTAADRAKRGKRGRSENSNSN